MFSLQRHWQGCAHIAVARSLKKGNIKMIVYRYGALKPTEGFDLLLTQLRLACRYRNALVELLNWRIIAEQSGVERSAAKLVHAEMSCWLRSRCGLGWGTYQAIEADVRRAAKSPYRAPRKVSGRARWFAQVRQIKIQRPPDADGNQDAQVREIGLDPTKFRARFRRFDGTGRLGANIQACSGATTDDVLSGRGSLRLSAPEGRVTARLYLGLGIHVTLPVIAHRPLPPGVQVVRALICVERVGDRYVYSVHVTMRHERPERQYGSGRAAINFGWRSLGDRGVRIAYVATDEGSTDELILPRRLIDKLRHSESLRGLADDAAVAYLGDARGRTRARREALRDPSATHRELGRVPIEGEPISAEHWARRDRHLYQWERDEYAKVLRQRREIYRLWVRSLAAKYGSVVMEDYDLPTLISRDQPTEIPEARHVRFLVAPGSLRAEVQSVFGERATLATIKRRTMVCSVCGCELTGDRVRDVVLYCEQCDAQRDQDANNAANQLIDTAAE